MKNWWETQPENSNQSVQMKYMIYFFLHRRGHDVFVAMPFCNDKTELNYTTICSDPEQEIMPMIDSITEPILKVIHIQITYLHIFAQRI